MGFDLQQSRVLVTGASSGIGAGFAESFARAGATVGICARRADRLEEVAGRARDLGAEVHQWVTDLADFEQVDRLTRDALASMGGVDILVNNAGIPKRRHVTVTDYDTVERVTRINYLSPIRLTLALLPQMLERASGRIINVSSVAATLSSPGETAYAASKAALAVFSEVMNVDLWDSGVKILVVYPGIVDTELFSIPDNDPLTAPVEPITVAECVASVLDALQQDAVEVYTPAHFKDFAVAKANDIPGFLAGTAEFARQQRSAAS
ncbi:MAG TPA: SDR family NAD(P)-dependent oxidoreductase [Acidimicrobiia bacterium]